MSGRAPISFIATDDPATATTFYSDCMGLELLETSPYALVFADGVHMLRVQIMPDFEPASYTVHGWQVTDIEGEIEALVSKGVVFERFEHMPQNASGVWTTPDGNKIAWFKDPCGNMLSLTEFVAR